MHIHLSKQNKLIYMCIYIYAATLKFPVLKSTSVPHSIKDLVRQENRNLVRYSFGFARNLERGHAVEPLIRRASHYAIPRGFEDTTLLGKSKHVLFGSKNTS